MREQIDANRGKLKFNFPRRWRILTLYPIYQDFLIIQMIKKARRENERTKRVFCFHKNKRSYDQIFYFMF